MNQYDSSSFEGTVARMLLQHHAASLQKHQAVTNFWRVSNFAILLFAVWLGHGNNGQIFGLAIIAVALAYGWIVVDYWVRREITVAERALSARVGGDWEDVYIASSSSWSSPWERKSTRYEVLGWLLLQSITISTVLVFTS